MYSLLIPLSRNTESGSLLAMIQTIFSCKFFFLRIFEAEFLSQKYDENNFFTVYF